MPSYIQAKEGPKHTVLYTDDKGKIWEFSGGTRPWRNQNPGNLIPGKVSKRNHAIGVAGGFAVFSSYEIGHIALLDSLKNMHGNKDIEKLIGVYAPKKDNNTKKYIKFVCKKTKIKNNKKIKDFSPQEFESLWKAIEQMEGWGPNNIGIIKEIKQKLSIISVIKDKKGVIASYYIEEYGLVTKEKGVKLAKRGEISAVVVTSPSGRSYLRSQPHTVALGNRV